MLISSMCHQSCYIWLYTGTDVYGDPTAESDPALYACRVQLSATADYGSDGCTYSAGTTIYVDTQTPLPARLSIAPAYDDLESPMGAKVRARSVHNYYSLPLGTMRYARVIV